MKLKRSSYKLGCQTIIFGPVFWERKALVDALDLVKSFGFDGIELAQRLHPEFLGGVSDIEELAQLLSERDLELLGVSGGELDERLRFIDQEMDVYYYVDRLDFQALEAIDKGSRVAIHPHAFSPIDSIAKSIELLNTYPNLGMIPDTAHAAIAKDDVYSVLDSFPSRVVALHLKDWSPKYGRSPSQCAKGFENLGEGDLRLREAVNFGKDAGITTYIWELDYSKRSIKQSFKGAMDWLEKSFGKRKRVRQSSQFDFDYLSYPKSADSNWLKQIRWPMQSISTSDPSDVFDRACDIIVSNSSSTWVNLYSLTADTKDRFKATQIGSAGKKDSLLISNDVCNCVSLKSFTRIQDKQGKNIVLIGVSDVFNRQFVQYILAIEDPSSEISFKDGFVISRDIAIAINNSMDRKCVFLDAAVNSVAAKSKSKRDFCWQLSDMLSKELRLAKPSVFAGKSDEEVANRIHCPAPHDFANRIAFNSELRENFVDLIGANCGERNASREPQLFWQTLDAGGKRIYLVWEKNQEVKKYQKGIFDSISRVIVRNIQYFEALELRNKLRELFGHSITQPLFEMRLKIDMLKSRQAVRLVLKKLTYPIFEDLESWIELIEIQKRFLGKPQKLGKKLPTSLYHQVSAAIRNSQPVLNSRRFKSKRGNVNYEGLRKLPLLLVNRSDFQRIFFNLLGNAIKYAYTDPSIFRVEINTHVLDCEYTIDFCDYGIGIDKQYADRIFDLKFRIPNAHSSIAGEGFGLYFVRQILARYGGKIELIGFAQPTQFRIKLPKNLRYIPNKKLS